MQIAFCANCGKHTGHKRVVGTVGVVTILFTAGANLLAYKTRCVICGLSSGEAQQLTAPAPSFCTGCGKQHAAADVFCTGCGKRK